jgi:transcriptional regulator with XRE-family HTH domain
MVSASDLMMHLACAVGKCQNQVPESCDIGMYQRHDPKGWDLWPALQAVPGESLRKDATRVPEVRSPTVRRRELGALLRTLRTEQGLTVEQVAERLLCSPSKVSRMETGHRGATLRDVRDLCDLYEVRGDAERDRMMELAREGKQQGWWQSYDLPWATYIGLETEAVSVTEYKSSLVPGLLQTADYMRAVVEAVVPALSADEVNQRVEVRLTRQHRLVQDEPLVLRAVLDEAVLHRAVGGPAVMAAQLRRVIEAASMPNVTVQVVPYDIGAHPAAESNFNLLEFTPPVPDVVYVEGLMGFMYLEQPQDLARYRQIFQHLQILALSEQGSMELIARIKNSYDGSLFLLETPALAQN